MADDKDKEKVPVTEVLEEDDEFEVGRHVVSCGYVYLFDALIPKSTHST